MEVVVKKHELVRQLQFPPGFRFVPTKEELIDVYLRCKIEGRKPPLDVVNEVIILEWQPGRLVEAYKGYGEHKWYFFTAREPSSSNKEKEPNRKVRVPGVNATWKATGSVMNIRRKGKDDKVVIGTKRVLIYHSSDADEDGKWTMHEYVSKEHSEIGQYSLCSIQRKQHSETEDSAGEASGSSKPKRKTTNMETAKTTKRKKEASTQAEGAQQQQKQEKTPRVPRKTSKRKNMAASTQAERAQQQQQQEMTLHNNVPAEPPLTLPEQAHQMLQQEQPSLGFHQTIPPAVPLQGYPHPDGIPQLGVYTPMHAGHALARSFQCSDMAQILMQNHPALWNQWQQPRSFTGSPFISPDGNVENVQYQVYQQCENYDGFGAPDQRLHTGQHLGQNLDVFSSDITQDSSNIEYGPYGGYQLYQQENIGAQYYEQQGHGDGGVFAQTGTGHGSSADGQFAERLAEDDDDVAIATKQGDDNVAFPADEFSMESFVDSLLVNDDPQDKVDSNGALQSQHELHWSTGPVDNSSILPMATCAVGPPLAVKSVRA
ncbi:uncharacterized protein LOC133884190 [Phragmites australis]|uniref:uncharacterized protein LOC133884190 n=1 Tax=Phragmites australis TaxID=29695 RepID=UPI002D78A5FD|nr:uncharacterized protein LOC133884190 [Phragmites australis]